MKHRYSGILGILLGVLLLLGAGALTAYNFYEDNHAGEQATEILSELNTIRPMERQYAPLREMPSDLSDYPEAVELPMYIRYPEMEMPTVRINGRSYIGTVEIPVLGLELPILQDWSDSLLLIAPCRFSGSVYQDNMILAGHNYDSHFGKLTELVPGDELRFVDAAGNVFVYCVEGIETLNGDAVETLRSGDWDLTLFTCTYGGRSRVTIRCGRVEPAE